MDKTRYRGRSKRRLSEVVKKKLLNKGDYILRRVKGEPGLGVCGKGLRICQSLFNNEFEVNGKIKIK